MSGNILLLSSLFSLLVHITTLNPDFLRYPFPAFSSSWFSHNSSYSLVDCHSVAPVFSFDETNFNLEEYSIALNHEISEFGLIAVPFRISDYNSNKPYSHARISVESVMSISTAPSTLSFGTDIELNKMVAFLVYVTPAFKHKVVRTYFQTQEYSLNTPDGTSSTGSVNDLGEEATKEFRAHLKSIHGIGIDTIEIFVDDAIRDVGIKKYLCAITLGEITGLSAKIDKSAFKRESFITTFQADYKKYFSMDPVIHSAATSYHFGLWGHLDMVMIINNKDINVDNGKYDFNKLAVYNPKNPYLTIAWDTPDQQRYLQYYLSSASLHNALYAPPYFNDIYFAPLLLYKDFVPARTSSYELSPMNLFVPHLPERFSGTREIDCNGTGCHGDMVIPSLKTIGEVTPLTYLYDCHKDILLYRYMETVHILQHHLNPTSDRKSTPRSLGGTSTRIKYLMIASLVVVALMLVGTIIIVILLCRWLYYLSK